MSLYYFFCFQFCKACLFLSPQKPSSQKTLAMALQSGKIKVLVSTTVIEVGIDIPAVDTIAILGADRFGIATLHQLRGRVGRDGRQAECYLLLIQHNILIKIIFMHHFFQKLLVKTICIHTANNIFC